MPPRRSEPTGGGITLTTGLAEVGDERPGQFVTEPELAPGTCVYLEMRDTGCGMDGETVKKIFDPFFTTKLSGRGLGLAAVLAIVRGHKGALRVTSTPGAGSAFAVDLPEGSLRVRRASPEAADAPWRGAGPVLLVDDEPSVRHLLQRVLEKLGFDVLSASNGEEAVQGFEKHGGEFRVVLLDATMPGISGEETLRRLAAGRAERPRVIVMSGYSEAELRERFAEQEIAGILQKPFTYATIQKQLREVLG